MESIIAVVVELPFVFAFSGTYCLRSLRFSGIASRPTFLVAPAAHSSLVSPGTVFQLCNHLFFTVIQCLTMKRWMLESSVGACRCCCLPGLLLHLLLLRLACFGA